MELTIFFCQVVAFTVVGGVVLEPTSGVAVQLGTRSLSLVPQLLAMSYFLTVAIHN
jgi:hypothetical protein